jgi:hypothetical protein
MTRQEQFKKELFELFLKYDVEMSVEERSGGVGGYDPVVVGINFWSTSHPPAEMIDLTVGKWENGKE